MYILKARIFFIEKKKNISKKKKRDINFITLHEHQEHRKQVYLFHNNVYH